jgi:hypothetical protein
VPEYAGRPGYQQIAKIPRKLRQEIDPTANQSSKLLILLNKIKQPPSRRTLYQVLSFKLFTDFPQVRPDSTMADT